MICLPEIWPVALGLVTVMNLLLIKNTMAVLKTITGNKTLDISCIQAHMITFAFHVKLAFSAGAEYCTDEISGSAPICQSNFTI